MVTLCHGSSGSQTLLCPFRSGNPENSTTTNPIMRSPNTCRSIWDEIYLLKFRYDHRTLHFQGTMHPPPLPSSLYPGHLPKHPVLCLPFFWGGGFQGLTVKGGSPEVEDECAGGGGEEMGSQSSTSAPLSQVGPLHHLLILTSHCTHLPWWFGWNSPIES